MGGGGEKSPFNVGLDSKDFIQWILTQVSTTCLQHKIQTWIISNISTWLYETSTIATEDHAFIVDKESEV